MVMRSIQSPGVEIREIDASDVSPAIVGTYCFVQGFADKGQEKNPLIMSSINDFEAEFGEPTNEAERYFYYAAREVVNNGGTLVAAKLPYNNTMADNYKYLGFDLGTANTISGGSPNKVKMAKQSTLGEPTSGNLYDYYSTITVDSSVSQISRTSYDILVAGGELSGQVGKDFIIVNESKARFTGPEEKEGLFIVLVDPLEAMKKQQIFDEDLYNNSTVSGIVELMDSLTAINISGDTIPTSALAATLSNQLTGDSVSEDIAAQFPKFEVQNGVLNKEYSNFIGVVVLKTFNDRYDEGRINVSRLESFVGSLHKDKRNKATGQSEFIGDIINARSQYIKFYARRDLTSTNSLTDNSVLYVTGGQNASLIGFNQNEAVKYIDGASMISNINDIFEKVSNIDEVQLDVIVDAGVSTIAQFTDDSATNTYDPANEADPNDVVITSTSSIATWRAVCDTYIEFCADIRKDCMCILDVPRNLVLLGDQKYVRPTAPDQTFSNTIGRKLRYVTGLNSSYAALYSDWLRGLDSFTGVNFWMPQTVKMAGIYCYNDRVANIWDAPAGLNRGVINGVNDLAFNPNRKNADQLYIKSLNYVMKYPLDGFIAEGQKTTQVKPSAFDRVNVRRLFLRLERYAYQVARYFVYEPNNIYTRRRVVDALDPVFKQYQSEGGLYDYQIVCDETNNPPEVIDRNELKVAILLQPVRTAEFILIDFIATRTNADFAEIIQQFV